MSQYYAYSHKDQEKTAETFFSEPKSAPSDQSSHPSKYLFHELSTVLIDRKTQLNNSESEFGKLKGHLTSLEMESDKLKICNNFLISESQQRNDKHRMLLAEKDENVHKVRATRESLLETQDQRRQLEKEKGIMKDEVQKLKVIEKNSKMQIAKFYEENKSLGDYNMEIDQMIHNKKAQALSKVEQVDRMAQTACTLESFSRNFKKNIASKGIQLNQAQFTGEQILGMMKNKQAEINNLRAKKTEQDWEISMYIHHSKEIQGVNQKLTDDLDNLVKHLNSLKKNNKLMEGCLGEFSEIGQKTAKKILKQANK